MVVSTNLMIQAIMSLVIMKRSWALTVATAIAVNKFCDFINAANCSICNFLPRGNKWQSQT